MCPLRGRRGRSLSPEHVELSQQPLGGAVNLSVSTNSILSRSFYISFQLREREVFPFSRSSSFPHDNLSNFSLFLSFLPFFVTYFLVTTFYYTSFIPNFPSSFSDSLPSFLPCLLLLFVMTQNTFSHSVFSRPLLLLTSSSSFCPD